MKLINADTVVHWQTYDDGYETFSDYEGTIAEFLDAMTDEGCPEGVEADMTDEILRKIKDRINQEIDELKVNGEKHSDDVRHNGLLIAEGLQMALRIIEEIFSKEGDHAEGSV